MWRDVGTRCVVMTVPHKCSVARIAVTASLWLSASFGFSTRRACPRPHAAVRCAQSIERRGLKCDGSSPRSEPRGLTNSPIVCPAWQHFPHLSRLLQMTTNAKQKMEKYLKLEKIGEGSHIGALLAAR